MVKFDFPVVPAIKAIFTKSEEKPTTAPAASTLVFDSKDAAIISLGVALILCAIAIIVLAARSPVAVRFA